MHNALIFSRGIWNIPHLAAFLPECHLQKAGFLMPARPDVVMGWGLRSSARKARAYATQRELPYIALEDGFLRSLGLGVAGWPPFSMVHDDLGIYYDTSRPSRLEQLLLAADNMPSETLAEAQKAIRLIVANCLSKYNHAPDFSETSSPQAVSGNGLISRPSEKKRVLVIDQTFGDMAVQCGGADAATFENMFQTALQENPDAEIWVKTHPDVVSGKKRGYLGHLSSNAENVRLLAQDINPISLLLQVDKVYCATSQMGFEALLCGKPVATFGLPWYAGWGVSDDRHADIAALAAQNRRAPRTLTQLFAAAYLQYSRYINPNTGEAGTLFDVIDYLAAARRLNEKLRGNVYCVGMSMWKRAVMKPFFKVPSCRLHFVPSLKKLQKTALPPDARLLVWSRGHDALIDFAHRRALPLLRMEDGFIRSVGLGSNLVPPLSLVVDDIGIYFNAKMPSRLEHILQNQLFNEQDFQTASSLQTMLTEGAITKYNVGHKAFNRPATDKKILLVPGQVEDDASIRYGSPKIYKNLDLLQTVRQLNPDAYIIYKPHPDVVTGNRIGHISTLDAAEYADDIITEADILSCLQHIDEVHTMTSLTGFEALLRDKTVYCYGLPFYAGWGLTQDYLALQRRNRKLALWELIAGTLIHYPAYIHPVTRSITDAHTTIITVKQQKQSLKNNNMLSHNWLRQRIGELKQLYLLFK